MKRRMAREKAMQALYQIDISGDIEPKVAIENTLEEGETSDEFLEDLVVGCVQHKAELDGLISKHLENWKLERVGTVDRNILRIAVYEMKFMKDIPENVTMNEAIEVAKVFGDEESKRFINGVLSKVKQSI
ncbi:transcription antitermination factor NusB [Bacillus sp. 165]|uniref:transcription antitermination factor NusB n=1 Tax=Bacillus sp. 165 TaxID=1529117 RepID=UPI001ADD4779|nr:transcription antitermination factor NusB [Bacillus sp. 165]MBO9129712.1 transcription antitermination factor NusB [Bacillus sp. 165]